MGELVIRNGVKLTTTPSSGSGDPILTRDATTGTIGEISSAVSTTLNSGQILVGNVSNVATAVTPSGDVTISNTGVTSIGTGVIVNADVNASAAIAVSKLATITASRAIVSDGSGFISASAVTGTELGYLSGVSSAIQTQLNAKQATITGGATTIVSSDLTVNRALISSGTGKVAVSAVTNTELGYVSGVTSALQTQLDTKLTVLLTGSADGDILIRSGGGYVNLAIGTVNQVLTASAGGLPEWASGVSNGLTTGGSAGQYLKKNSGTDFDASWDTLTLSDVTDITASAAELNILDGVIGVDATEIGYLANVTSDIQNQFNNKLGTGLTQNNIYVGNASNVATATTDLPTGTTIGSAQIYRVGGSDVTLADGGTGTSLADPNADRIMFWDDSAGQVTWLDLSGLSISGTTLGGWGLTGTSTLTGVATISSNTANQHVFNGTWTASANSQEHITVSPAITARATVSDLLTGIVVSPTLIAGANTQNLSALDIDATYTEGAHTGTLKHSLRALSGSVVIGHTTVNATDTRLLVRGLGNSNSVTAVFQSLGGNSNVILLDSGECRIKGPVVVGNSSTAAISNLESLSSFGSGITNVTTNTTLNSNHYTVLCDATSGNITITLPTAVSSLGRIYNIKKIDASVNTVTIDGNGAELIDGATTNVLTTQWDTKQIQSNSSAWYVI